MTKRLEISRTEIEEKFLQHSVQHGVLYVNGDYKKANKLHKELHNLYNHAKEQREEELFSEMLDNPDEYVKLWAAIFTLKSKPDIAENILKKLSTNSKVKMTASATLHLWKEVKLELLL